MFVDNVLTPVLYMCSDWVEETVRLVGRIPSLSLISPSLSSFLLSTSSSFLLLPLFLTPSLSQPLSLPQTPPHRGATSCPWWPVQWEGSSSSRPCSSWWLWGYTATTKLTLVITLPHHSHSRHACVCCILCQLVLYHVSRSLYCQLHTC